MPEAIRSALFIDFEHMPLARDAIEGWLGWLEDGRFDGGQPRRLALKRVYWGASAHQFRPVWEAAGFEVVHCDRFDGLANSIDVQMAIDIVEAGCRRRTIDEYILITRDSDFVPVLRRLRERGKRTAFVVDESRSTIHSTYRAHADVLIPTRELGAARDYIRLETDAPSARTRPKRNAAVALQPELPFMADLSPPAPTADRARASSPVARRELALPE
jgi:hypothetical protein